MRVVHKRCGYERYPPHKNPPSYPSHLRKTSFISQPTHTRILFLPTHIPSPKYNSKHSPIQSRIPVPRLTIPQPVIDITLAGQPKCIQMIFLNRRKKRKERKDPERIIPSPQNVPASYALEFITYPIIPHNILITTPLSYPSTPFPPRASAGAF